MRIRCVPAGDAFDRRFEVIEAALLHQRDKLRAKAAGFRRFVDNQAAARLLDRLLDRLDVERDEGAEVDDFGVNSALLDRSERDWIVCRLREGRFEGFGGPRNLEEILEVFLQWAEKARA